MKPGLGAVAHDGLAAAEQPTVATSRFSTALLIGSVWGAAILYLVAQPVVRSRLPGAVSPPSSLLLTQVAALLL